MLRYLNNYIRTLKNNSLPSWIVFFVTNRCNLFCKHCFYSQELNKDINELSLEEIKNISLSLNKVSKLFISGGEPFLRSDLGEICEIFHKQNSCKLIYIPTNGLLIENIDNSIRYILRKCKDIRVTVTFSLEGTKELNDMIRGPGTFDKTIESLRHLCEIKKELNRVNVIVSSTISDYNVDSILDLFNFIKKEVNIDYHTYDPIRNLTDNNDPLFSLSSKKWRDLTKSTIQFDKYYFRKAKQKGIKLFCHLLIKKYIYKIQADSLKNKKWPFRCLAGNVFGVIEPNGDIKLCELINKNIGNLREKNYDFKYIWFSKEAEILRNQIMNGQVKICLRCTNGCCCLVPSLLYSPVHLLKAATGLY
jgi:radical SAM protein with 4Fe4S-binding SPASM domain